MADNILLRKSKDYLHGKVSSPDQYQPEKIEHISLILSDY